MTQLRDLLEDLVREPGPVHGVEAEDLYAAGRRRHRHQRTVTAAVAVAVTVAVTATAAARWDGGRNPENPAPPAGDATVSPDIPVGPREDLQGIIGVDGTRLYGWRLHCPAPPCDKRWMRVVGSDDGGRTWTERGRPAPVARLAVLDRDTLLAAPADADSHTSLLTSVDGGRSWEPVPVRPAVREVPAGAAVTCLANTGTGTGTCRLAAVGPAAGGLAALATAPPLKLTTNGLAVSFPDAEDGFLRVSGADPGSGRPAVAVSADRGRTWSTRVFTEPADCLPGGCDWRSMATGSGSTGYLVIDTLARQRPVVYRAEPGDNWRRLDTDAIPLGESGGADPGWMTAEGRHVWCEQAPVPAGDGDGCRFWAVGPGERRYRQASPPGLPGRANPVRRGVDGSYHTTDRRTGLSYTSADGWTWTPAPAR
ncbi:hypothetical protein [Plantactinospora sp. GCM10030261]|uniref:hypothetical protein n=1 Tax=Plantactinospora sp. GCM10030261 TaxID=3273420 RepID=UPI00361FC728